MFNALPILNYKNKSFFKIEDIAEVELIGGCSRIPKIKQIVAEFFKKDPMTTMNLDDAIARGCALQAALLSPTVIMKEV
jgi:molecular chaperone DnaK (HSP70)